jgi:conserved hypothetical protein
LTLKNSKLKIIPLGGLNEIGKNITVFEYGNDILIVDCGLAFPEDDMFGIDLVIPDFSYLIANKNKIRALILTHGHEDHIGAVSYLLRHVKVPIYGTKLTLGLLKNKLREHNVYYPDMHFCVSAGQIVKFGTFSVEFIRTNHSIADSVALAINTPLGMVVHSGDFKVDYTPIEGKPIDLQRFAEIGKRGVLLFLCESTNVESKGYTLSEKTVGDILERIFEESPKQRLMIATFSSNIHRIQQIINSAFKHRRKVVIAGRSMISAVRTAAELGYLNIPSNILIETAQIKNYPPERLVIITTGSQGEEMSALARMVSHDHKQIEVLPGDKIIISASSIPGNEKAISKVIDGLLKLGAEVVYEKLMEVHVSGHAKQEEIKLLHVLLKPKYLMPVHGEYRHLKKHKDLAVSLGMDKRNVFLMNIGDVLEIDKKDARINGIVPAGQVLVDGLGIGDVGNVVLRDRKILAEDGLMIVILGVQRDTGLLVTGPDVITRGFVYVKESEYLISGAKRVVAQALDNVDGNIREQWLMVKALIRDTLNRYLWQNTKRRPMILPILVDVQS